MHTHFSRNQNFFIFASLIAGVIFGVINSPIINNAAVYTVEAFMNLLKFISLPLIFLSIISAIAKLEDKSTFKNILGRTLTYTLLTTIIAAIIAMILYQVIQPASTSVKEEQLGSAMEAAPIAQYILNMIPSNMVKMFSDNNVMAIVSAALLLGISTLFLETQQRHVIHKAFDAFFNLFMVVARFIVKLMPLVIWAFITIFARDLQSGFGIEKLMYYVIAIAAANILQAFAILPIFLKSKGISPIETFKGMLPALTTAFFSKSSSATMPSTLHCLQTNLKVDKKVASITVPLCTTINMNACAAFIYITVLFVAESNGMTFTTIDYITWVFMATIAAIGNAGVPMGCFFMASAYLASMNVSTYLMGVILPFYAILDMFETAINVWSDACVTRAINKDYSKK